MDPFDEEKGLYSIYGYLDLDKEVNYIRVKDLNATLTTSSTDNINATVTLENTDENIVETLQDTLVKFEDIYTHNFRTTMEINPVTSYEITVERSDGKSVTATATTPQVADVNWGPTNDYCHFPFEITFEPVINRYDLELSVGFDYEKVRFWVTPDVSHQEGKLLRYRFIPINLINEVFSGPDSEPIKCNQLDDDVLFVKYTHYGPDFNSAGSDTLDIPTETVTFGALYEDSFSFRVDTSDVCPPICSPSDTVTRSTNLHELLYEEMEL